MTAKMRAIARSLLLLTASAALLTAAPGAAQAQLIGSPPPASTTAVTSGGPAGALGAPGALRSLPGLGDDAHALDQADSFNPLAVLARAAKGLPGESDVGGGGGAGSGGKGTGGSGGGTGTSGTTGLSTPVNILLVLTVIGLVPSIMLMTTCFLRIIVVLGLLRQALGTQQLPPAQVITGLALAMTLVVMAPTVDRINREAVQPYRSGQITDYDVLWNRAKQPLRDFMFDQIEATGNYSSLIMVLNYRGVDTSRPETITRDRVDMVSLVPAYVLSELKTAFLMGFKVYLPFLVIDMVISALLISMSMMMLPPVLISLPFKLLLFVLVDGWTLVVGGLLKSFVVRPAEVEAAWRAAEGSLVTLAAGRGCVALSNATGLAGAWV